MMNVRHTQRTIQNPIGIDVEVDEGLADLLLRLWAEGYVTVYSCQESGRDEPYIMFPGLPDAERFVANYGGTLSPIEFVAGRRVVDGFVIPE